MNKAALVTLLLFTLAETCEAAPHQETRDKKKAYAFPKRVQTPQTAPAEEEWDEMSAFASEDDWDGESQERMVVYETPKHQPPTKLIKKKRSVSNKHFRLDIAPQYSYMILRSDGMKKQKGSLWGITGEAEYKKREHVYADASFLWDQGDIHADGHRSREWKEAVVQGMIGYTVSVTDRMSTTPYVGFGYRKVMYHHGFNHRVTLDYYQYFVPFGFLTDYHFNSRFCASLNLKAMPAVDSRVYFANQTNVFWKLKNKGNYEVQLPLKWTAAKTRYLDFDLSLVPFFKYWVLGTNSKQHLHSKSQTYWGVELQFGFTL